MTSATRPVIRGSVISPAGTAIAFAPVMIEQAPAPFPDIAVLTDADGGFALPTVGPGWYGIAVNAEGYPMVHRRLEVAGGDIFVRIEVE